MGKATILVGPITLVIVLLIIWAIARSITKADKEPKSVRQNAELADEAMRIFKRFMVVQDINHMDILTEESKRLIISWTEKYREVNK